MDLFLKKNHILRYWDRLSSKLDRGFYMISVVKTASKKIGASIRSMKFLSPEGALYVNLPYDHAWNTVAMPGLLPLAATWQC